MTNRIAYLDGTRLKRCLQSGLQQLVSEREYLNRINVFPVPDGDTGNNLAHTARAALGAMLEHDRATVSETVEDLANGALDGAQGNSGVILAQFMQGLAEGLAGKERADTASFATALKIASAASRAALTEPREGTIISVMDAAARAAADNSESGDFAVFLPAVVAAAESALAATPDQLAALRAAKVVDAGGQGFCAILQGCNDFLLQGSLRELPQPVTTDIPEVFQHDHMETDPTFRYCTECLLAGEGMNIAAVREQLAGMGDSIVIAGSGRRLRIHIHSDDPEAVFELAATHGELLKTKADDMAAQSRALQASDRKVAVVTDSAADLPDEMVRELGIHIVPLRVLTGEESHLDKLALDVRELEEMLHAGETGIGTSQPTQGDFRRMYEFLGTHFAQIVSLHLGEKLSGTFQGALAAKEASNHTDKIAVIDTGTASVGQALAVRRTAMLANQGMHGEELVRAARLFAPTIRSFALVNNLETAVRSGRLSRSVKRIADTLRLVPVLHSTPDGRITAQGFLPGRHNLINRFARRITRRFDADAHWEFAIAHGPGDDASGDALAAAVKQRLPKARLVWKTEVGAALGLHAGLDSLIVALHPADADTPA